MKFAFIAAREVAFPVITMCRVLGVTRGGFYAWKKRPKPARARSDAQLAAAVAAVIKPQGGSRMRGSGSRRRPPRRSSGVPSRRLGPVENGQSRARGSGEQRKVTLVARHQRDLSRDGDGGNQ